MVSRASALGARKRFKSDVEWEEERRVYRACTKERIKGTVVKQQARSREADPDPSDMQAHTSLARKAENVACWWVKIRHLVNRWAHIPCPSSKSEDDECREYSIESKDEPLNDL